MLKRRGCLIAPSISGAMRCLLHDRMGCAITFGLMDVLILSDREVCLLEFWMHDWISGAGGVF